MDRLQNYSLISGRLICLGNFLGLLILTGCSIEQPTASCFHRRDVERCGALKKVRWTRAVSGLASSWEASRRATVSDFGIRS